MKRRTHILMGNQSSSEVVTQLDSSTGNEPPKADGLLWVVWFGTVQLSETEEVVERLPSVEAVVHHRLLLGVGEFQATGA